MDNIQVFVNTLLAHRQSIAKKPVFRITVTHKTGMELVAEEEGRRKMIKSLQRENKRNKVKRRK